MGLLTNIFKGRGRKKDANRADFVPVAKGQGPFTPWFGGYVPRQVSPEFYKVLREGIPYIDGAIRRLSTLTGTLQVEGNNAKLVNELTEFFTYIPVNDFHMGIQPFLNSFQEEAFEQGFGMGEYVYNDKRNDIVALRNGDSMLIHFVLDDAGKMGVVYRPSRIMPTGYNALRKPEQVLRGTWNAQGYFPAGTGITDIPINMENKLYLAYHSSNQNPYGVSIESGMEFVGQFLLTLENSGLNTAERFGDPSYVVKYKSAKSLSPTDATARRNVIAEEFNKAISAKRKGQSADFIQVMGKDDDIEIKVVGADGKTISQEFPMKHCVEAIISKTGLAPWMIGVTLSGSNSVKEQEINMALADAEVRKASLLPSLNILARNLLKARGRTWRPGDWTLVLKSPSLHDLISQAQAGFLNAQAHLMESGAGLPVAGTETKMVTEKDGSTSVTFKRLDAAPPLAHSLKAKLRLYRNKSLAGGIHACSESKDKGPAAEEISSAYLSDISILWSRTAARVSAVLSLPETDKAKFEYSADQLAQVKVELMKFVSEMVSNSQDKHGPIVTFTGRAHALGLMQAAEALGNDTPSLDLIKNKAVFDELVQSGFELVRNKTTIFYQDEIKAAMEAGMARGANPKDIARELEGLFGDYNKDWERLARSETALAQETGKLSEWTEMGVKMVRFAPAPGACTICTALAGEYKIGECPVPMSDTHPRCTCAITLA